jgi:hypothetical protein
MKRKKRIFTGKGILLGIQSTLLLVMVCIVSACSKKSEPVPQPRPTATIVAGMYRIIEDQGSDNGDTVYYTRKLSACDTSTRYVFSAKTLTASSSCAATATASWTYNPATAILTISDSQGTGTIKIENLTSTGFVWNAIATGEDNARYTFQLIN